ncbi:MAG TPA: M48 family metalloprotease [Usitatibacter sp.]|nr:M48 family metalloprotease [Usitatibacter sp.]
MRLRAVIALALAACIATPALPQGLPDLGDVSSAALSDAQEKTIGDRIMRDIRSDPAYVDDPEISDYINWLGNRLLLAADGPRRTIDFFVVRDDTINAFALPGGHIGVNSGLVLLTQNESELAGVVGHEIGHILQRHQARSIQEQRGSQFTSLAALALALLAARSGSSQAGQVTEAAVASAGALTMSTQLSYSREHEREADRVGLGLLDRAGFSPRAMVTFFQRMLQANRVNEFKGAPAYLQNHPLTVERIADMQDRVESMPPRIVSDSTEYGIARAKLRAEAGSPSEAVAFFRGALVGKTVVRPRDDVYGLALALRRERSFDAAWKTLAPLRAGGNPHPAYELLAGEIKADMGQTDAALAIYRAALQDHPDYRALIYAYLDLLEQAGHPREVLADVEKRLRSLPDDPRLYEIQARACEAVGNFLGQHRAQAEALYRRDHLAAAVDQLEIALKAKGSDFYGLSSAEARLREMRALLDNQRAAEKALKIS